MKGEMASTTSSNNSEVLGMNELRQTFSNAVTSMQTRMSELEEKEKWWKATQEEMEKHATAAANKITLDIGGQKFATSKTTLLSQKGSFFAGMLSSGHWKPDADGSYFIDRNPELFPVILDYLRTGKVNLKKFSYDINGDLKTELEFYKIIIPDEVLGIAFIQDTKLLDKQQQKTIMEWVGNRQLTLLYSATRDGFGANIFHQKCDNRGPTLVVIKSANGYLFGGYASVPWDSSATNKKAKDSYLFTLTNPHNIAPTKYLCNTYQENEGYYEEGPYYQVTYNPNCGPVFGNYSDISITNNANSNNKSCTGFPNSYKDTTGHHQGANTFTGARNFVVADYEVFQVV